MGENPKEWPRVHTCLYNWCPRKSDKCCRCDSVLDIVRKAYPSVYGTNGQEQARD